MTKTKKRRGVRTKRAIDPAATFCSSSKNTLIMGDEEIAAYALALRELKVNSKPVIPSLTMLAPRDRGRRSGAAARGHRLVERHIERRLPRRSSPGFYLLDSARKTSRGTSWRASRGTAGPVPRRVRDGRRVHTLRWKRRRRLLSTWNWRFPANDSGRHRQVNWSAERGGVVVRAAFRTGAGAPCLPPQTPLARRMNAAAAGPLLASMVQGDSPRACLKSIAAAKAAQRAGSPAEAARRLCPPPRRARAPPPRRRCSPRSRGRPRSTSPRADRGLRPERRGRLRRRRARVVDALYGDLPHQCATTGVRFKTRAELDKHLDAQVVRRRAKRRARARARRAAGGSWTLRLGSEAPPPRRRRKPGPLLTTPARRSARRARLWKKRARPRMRRRRRAL